MRPPETSFAGGSGLSDFRGEGPADRPPAGEDGPRKTETTMNFTTLSLGLLTVAVGMILFGGVYDLARLSHRREH